MYQTLTEGGSDNVTEGLNFRARVCGLLLTTGKVRVKVKRYRRFVPVAEQLMVITR